MHCRLGGEHLDRGLVRARRRLHSGWDRFNSVTQQNKRYIPLSISPTLPNTAFSTSNITPESSLTSTDKNICFPYRRAVRTLSAVWHLIELIAHPA
jgi:hypothetical protein